MYYSIILLMMLTHLCYVAIVYHRVLDLPSKFSGYLKAIGAALLAIGGWMILSFIAISVYIIYGVL